MVKLNELVQEDACYTIISNKMENQKDITTENEFKLIFENGSTYQRIDALKTLIKVTLSGEKYPKLLMSIIQFVMPVQNHVIKKLLNIFWEVWPKYDADGKMIPEMILVCDAFRKDINHPNEFVCGHILRFLCKLNETELIEPLIPSVISCLQKPHPYARRNAVLAIYKIYSKFPYLMPEAPKTVFSFLKKENDNSCIIEAFMVLMKMDEKLTVEYLNLNSHRILKFDELLQLLIIEFIYKISLHNMTYRSKFIKYIYSLLNSRSSTVRYQSVVILSTMVNSRQVIKHILKTIIDLVVTSNDYNVKLICLDRVIDLIGDKNAFKLLKECVLDFLPVLSCDNIDVKRKSLDIILELVSSRSISHIITFLKKEYIKIGSSDVSYNSKYKHLLVKTLHLSCLKYPEFANTVVSTLVEFLSDMNPDTSLEVLGFVRELMEKIPQIKSYLIKLLLDALPDMLSSNVHSTAIWIIGEFVSEKQVILKAVEVIKNCIGTIPILDEFIHDDTLEPEILPKLPPKNVPTKNVISADGSYATQSAFTTSKNDFKSKDVPVFRTYFINGDYEIVTNLCFAFIKMTLKFKKIENIPSKQLYSFSVDLMLTVISIARFGMSPFSKIPILNADLDIIGFCLKFIQDQMDSDNSNSVDNILDIFRHAFKQFIEESSLHEKTKQIIKLPEAKAIGHRIKFNQLNRNLNMSLENQFDATLIKAVGNTDTDDVKELSKLNKIKQLTGFSDPVYCEAYVHLNRYDVILDILVINQTDDTLSNLSVELASAGNLKLVDKSNSVSIGPKSYANLIYVMKILSTENCTIYGNIVYGVARLNNQQMIIILNDINVEVMDYILPAFCDDEAFRKMWIDFEWENKINVNTNICEPFDYLQHLIKCTNLKCLTPQSALKGKCNFLTANLYAKTASGDDILANLSIENKITSGNDLFPVYGHVRIRAKTQGIALSLGDKISSVQKLPTVIL
ncbi:Beta-COP [Intoshia linei]|uniref:Coatomer subunit beta n=1 Tax=Intoshia linei TaxID=1819745 RepID=A0A177BDW8_9BILA|nr:Beta-COP [Intoshia linei]